VPDSYIHSSLSPRCINYGCKSFNVHAAKALVNKLDRLSTPRFFSIVQWLQVKLGAYQESGSLKGVPLYLALASFANIRLG